MLEVENLQVVYDDAIEALRNASFSVAKGGVTALLGSNGAGKTTVLKTVSGILYPEEGRVREGSVRFEGHDLIRLSPDEIVRLGVAHVPEGRRLFVELTVEENLMMGGYTVSRSSARASLDQIYNLFPRLQE